MGESTHLVLLGADSTARLGGCLGNAVEPPTYIALEGELGAGKTTLVRGFLRALGYAGIVKSPTYTLVEPYEFARFAVYHFDLYRLGSPAELETLGIAEFFATNAVCLVEWPDKGQGWLPMPDLSVRLVHAGHDRTATLSPVSSHGHSLLSRAQVNVVF